MMNAILMNQLQIIFGSYGFHSEHINHVRLGCRGMQDVNPRPQYILNRGGPGSQQSDPDAGMESSPEGQRIFKSGKTVLAYYSHWPRA